MVVFGVEMESGEQQLRYLVLKKYRKGVRLATIDIEKSKNCCLHLEPTLYTRPCSGSLSVCLIATRTKQD